MPIIKHKEGKTNWLVHVCEVCEHEYFFEPVEDDKEFEKLDISYGENCRCDECIADDPYYVEEYDYDYPYQEGE